MSTQTPRAARECRRCHRHMPHRARGLCRGCYKAESVAGRLEEWPTLRWRAKELAEAADELLVEFSAEDALDVLAISAGAAARAMYRAGRADLARTFQRIASAESRPDHEVPDPEVERQEYLHSVRARILSRSRPDPETGCIEWQGARDPDGYGITWAWGRKIPAHRANWIAHHDGAALTPEQFVLHNCDNPSCVEVTHLRLGDAAENMRDRRARARWSNGWGETRHAGDACRARGHERVPYPRGGGCLVCRKAQNGRSVQRSEHVRP